jgi:alpha-mannosidase
MLKASFPVNVNSSTATFEIPYGNIERPTHTNTSWEQEKFEVPAQKWADLSEFGFGVSILNDSKYSYDIRNNQMRITLLRSPDYPEPDADRGKHEFCYSLITHDGDWRKGGITRQAYQLNFPVITQIVKPDGGRLMSSSSLVKVDRENVIIEVVKKAENSSDLIIRLYEYFGARGNVNLSFGFNVKELYETDMLENKVRKIEIAERTNKISFFIKPYEIKTFKISIHSR